MKGIMFNYLEDFVTENYGVDAWEDLLTVCPMKSDKIFVGPNSYPDADFVSIIQTVCAKLKQEKKPLLYNFGYYLFGRLSEDFPDFVTPYDDPIPFLKSIDSVIHVEVRKCFDGANPPSFEYKDLGPDSLQLIYKSKRNMCELLEGIIDGVAEKFDREVEANQTSCVLHGDDSCSFDLKFKMLAKRQ